MKNDIRLMEFNAASVPQYQEVIKNKPWVYYGDDNVFPNHLLALYQYSSINRACLNAIMYGVKGKNIFVKEGNPEVLTMANRSETVYEVYEKLVTDRVLFGGFAMNIVKSNDGGIAEFYHTDFSRLRASKEDDFGNVGSYYYSINWAGTTTNPTKWKPVEIESFNMLPDSAPSQILYDKTCYTPGMSYYPAPDYLAGVTTIQLDIEIKNFHLNNMQNSMMPSMSVIFKNGVPGEDEMDMIQRQLESKYSSTNNAGKFFLFFAENPETAPEIIPIPNNASDAWYSNMAPQIENNILTSHRITSPMILGIRTPGSLGGRAEILDSYQLFLQTVIIPIQEDILKTLEKVLFIKYKEPIKLGVIQNQILPDDVENKIDIKEGI